MNDFEAMTVFMFVKSAMNEFVDALKPVPLDMLKKWLQTTKELGGMTPQQTAMQLFHTEVIEAYIKAREYATNHQQQKIKNN